MDFRVDFHHLDLAFVFAQMCISQISFLLEIKKTRFKLPYSSSLFLELLQAYYGVFRIDAPSRRGGVYSKAAFNRGGHLLKKIFKRGDV